ncbi:hypothetical protein DY000_02063535 [Brassica cretica]|uniref:Protein kinase domain-containing protein n=1 Tax=Brassica cretica TaxID=69181 RepID=A0ABQ7AML4_BRACR|nr:hypothetical protein DY000_02063535 [Brassica cretica]
MSSADDVKRQMTNCMLQKDEKHQKTQRKELSNCKIDVGSLELYAFEDNANVYIVMELCGGGELLDRTLARVNGKYSEDDAKAVLIQILNVVAFCHLQGVVHRDLKPEVNLIPQLLVQFQGGELSVKVIDFVYPWITGCQKMNIPFDILIFRQMKAYLKSSSLRKAALMVLFSCNLFTTPKSVVKVVSVDGSGGTGVFLPGSHGTAVESRKKSC